MNNDTNRDQNPQTDPSKAQSAQQPQGQADHARSDQGNEDTGSASGMADYGSAEKADAMTQNRTDVEGASQTAEDSEKQSGGFVGSDSQDDTSSELVEKSDQTPPDGK